MPIIRRRQPRARMLRRKLLARRYYKKKPLASRVYNFKRKLFLQDYLSVSSVTQFGAVQFTLADLPGYTDFTNLYDMYKINKVVFKLIPKYTEATLTAGSATANANCQQIHSVIDYDDANAPTSIGQLTQYQSHKMTRGNQVHTRTLIPKVQTQASSLSALPKANQWIDCDQTTIYHRGVKFCIPAPTSASTTIQYDAEITMYLSMKNVL